LGFKLPSSQFCIRIFLWYLYLEKLSKTYSYSSLSLSFQSSIFSKLGVHAHSNNITPATSPNYVWHPITKKHYSQLPILIYGVQTIMFPTDYFHFLKKNPQLLQCRLCPTKPPVHALILIYTSQIPWLVLWLWPIPICTIIGQYFVLCM
jgi:hypothetical protein